jgi:hypothetical protein
LPTQGSHRSVRARFAHTVPQMMVSLRVGKLIASATLPRPRTLPPRSAPRVAASPAALSVAVAWTRVRSSVPPPGFPPTGPSLDARFPPQGPRGPGSPASSVLSGAATPDRPSRRTSLPSFGGTPHGTLASLPRRGVQRRRPGVSAVPLRLPLPDSGGETTGPPMFLRNLDCAFALLCDPGRIVHPGPGEFSFIGRRRGPRSNHDEGSCIATFEAQSHSFSTRCLRLAVADYSATTQDSLPAAGLALPDGLGYPQGSNERFQSLRPTSSRPPFSGLHGARFVW